MLRMLTTGAQYFCDVCQEAILDVADGWGYFAPLNGRPEPVVILHEACRQSNVAETFLRGHSKRRLAELLDQADEACNRG